MILGKILSIRQIYWDIPDTRLVDDEATVLKMSNIITEIQPDYVFLPSFFDRHFDHFLTNRIFVRAVNHSKISIEQVCGYEVWDTLGFPNYIIDLGDHIEKKLECMDCYKIPLQAMDFSKLVKHRGSVNYMLYVDQSRVSEKDRYAETFIKADSQQYSKWFNEYVEILDKNNSSQLDHLHDKVSQTH